MKKFRMRSPKLKPPGMPIWSHAQADKMKLDLVNCDADHLTISGRGTTLTIKRAPESTRRNWVVSWIIIWSGVGEDVSGRIWMSVECLRDAFGLNTVCPEEGRPLINRFGGNMAFPGSFIRWHEFLNIPGPGTGEDGDPNISVKLSKQVIEAVSKLLGE